MFCKAILKCSTGHWADTTAIVQPNWYLELPKENKENNNTDRTPQSVFLWEIIFLSSVPTFPLPRFWLTAACRQRPSLRRSGTSCSCGGTRATRQPPAARCRRSPPPQSAAPSSSRRTCPEIIKVESDTDLVIYTTAHIFRFHTGTVSSSPKLVHLKFI